MQPTTSDRIISFLRSHPLISVRGLEESLDIPITSIKKAMLGDRGIPDKYHDKIISELKKYGFKK